MRARANVERWNGEAAVVLAAGDLAATFLPERGMLGVSLVHRGAELLALPKPVGAWTTGATTGMPLLHPWANRLPGWSYRAGGRGVRLRGLPLPVDERGLPIHGTVRATPFAVEALRARGNDAVLRARLHSADDALLTRAFPYAHDLVVEARVDANRLRVTTELHATGAVPVPLSFGWHPYFALTDAPRARWRLRLPARTEIALGDDFVPTGHTDERVAEDAPIGRRTFDTHYALGRDRRFVLESSARRLTVTFDAGYPFAQVYAPSRREFACIEPMVTSVGALGHGGAPSVAAGAAYRATFTVAVSLR